MTRAEAIRILDPETTGEALAEIEYYAGFNGQTAKVNAVSDACEVAVAAMRELEKKAAKELAEYLHPIDAYEGLKGKYLVFKADTGERVTDCFVLRPAKDHAAVEALRTYADVTENKVLAEDILSWIEQCKEGSND